MSRTETRLTIHLSGELRDRAEARATLEGTTLAEVIRKILEEYAARLDLLEEIDDARAVQEIEARVAAGEEQVSDWDEFEAELDAL